MSCFSKFSNDIERRNCTDMLRGCINRICITDDLNELMKLQRCAFDYICRLTYNRYLILKERLEENVNGK